ncbi:stress-induced-phosphoprotein 1-like isoform X2 [Scomber japonicus]|uniref:stress-induced-phosphoprotein 1-like isoform X2 n=1 Tax=Scomber japonicus TaxID=13676 RepID=UPI002305461F|nr:stress-induced-phosphoprotein 1-like isoform X2 [Scomber japonicus]
MPRKKEIVPVNTVSTVATVSTQAKVHGAPRRFKENSRIMRAHESMVDIINGRHSTSSFLDVFTSGLLGLDLFRGLDEELEHDLVYTDDEDDSDQFYPPIAGDKVLEPHPRIKQLTDAEADKQTEEERRRDKTERNKRKKMRKKEKKREKKENAVKDIIPEEEQNKSDSSGNQEENRIIESNAEANESPDNYDSDDVCEIFGWGESMPPYTGTNKEGRVEKTNKEGRVEKTNKEGRVEKMNKEEEEEEDGEQKDLNLNNASNAESAPKETHKQTPVTKTKEEKTELPEVQKPKEEKPKVQKKKEEKQETIKEVKEKTVDVTAEEYAKKSRELAGIGNRLAASGQYRPAVKCFTDAIKYNPTEFKLFGNRSLCYERMQQYENALRDADLALSMSPNWVKGLFRKGKALCGLKKYYEASLVYKEVLNLDSTSQEASQELKRAQTLHLMEMGFSWAQSSEALKTHATLEDAVETLSGTETGRAIRMAAASREKMEQLMAQQEEGTEEEGEWIVYAPQPNRPRAQQMNSLDQSRSKSESPTPLSKNAPKPELFPIWVGSLAPAVTYATLHELFSRAGTVYSIKMLLEHQCAFVNYTKKEDCDTAIKCINGMVVEGAPLSVRYPNKIPVGLGMSKWAATEPSTSSRPTVYKKECFFWRTTGCTRHDCTYRHIPEHKNIDKDKFTNKLTTNHM